jgi:hypothetical protein
MMRYELSGDEWTAIKPMLPHKPHGVPTVNDRCVLESSGSCDLRHHGATYRTTSVHASGFALA